MFKKSGYPGARRRPNAAPPHSGGAPYDAHTYGQPSSGASSGPYNPYAAASTGQHQHQHQHHYNASSHAGGPPPLSDPHGWFSYFDRDNSGSLDQEEVVAGLIRSHPNLDASSVREQVYAVWPAFDADGSGRVERHEFCSPGGMGEALLAATEPARFQQQQHQQQASAYGYAQASPYAPPPAASSSSSSLWTCDRCTFVNDASDRFCKACSGPAPAGAGIGAGPGAGPYVPGHSSMSSASSAASFPPSGNPHYRPAAQPHAHQPQTQPQPQQFQTVRVNIPPGMGPGQQLGVKTNPTSEANIVTIPPRNQWKFPPGGAGGAYFDIRFPKTGGAAASAPQQQPTGPTVVQGKYSSGPAVAPPHPQSYQSHQPSQPLLPWQPWESFSGGTYQPVPLGMQPVPPGQVMPRHMVSGVPPTGRRRALLIGINYRGTRAELRGCVNDAKNMKELLLSQGFRNDPSHMLMLVDEGSSGRFKPTKQNIIRGMQWLVHNTVPGDVLFFHFSGHGAQMPDKTGHEADGFNETILPSDYKSGGQISDDVIWGNIVWPLSSGVRLMALMDCCHSGTGLDLPYEYDLRSRRWIEDVNPAHSKGDVIQFSGCEDAQTSADAGGDMFSKYQAGGAMTQSFIRAFRENPHATYPALMDAIHRHLKRRGFPQRPALTSSQSFDVSSRVFSFSEGIEPNRNSNIGRIKNKHIRPGRANGSLQDRLFGGLGNVATAASAAAGAIALANIFLGD